MKFPLIWTVSSVLCLIFAIVAGVLLWSSSTFLNTMESPHVSTMPMEAHHSVKQLLVPPSPVGLNEVFVNVLSAKSDETHFLRFKLEVEVFDETSRALIEQRQSALRSTLIQTSREMNYERLSTLPGKLYFKEIVVGRMNEFLNQPAVKEVHFSAFNLQ